MMKMMMMTSYYYNDNNVEMIINYVPINSRLHGISLHPFPHPAWATHGYLTRGGEFDQTNLQKNEPNTG